MLSPKVEFKWSVELEEAFVKAKESIVKSVKKGVVMFNVNKLTVLNTDWSKTGILFAIFQKHCSCSGINIICCRKGWRLVLCNSRFCSPAEGRYFPVEGEALAVAWGMKKGKYFLLGAKDLSVVADH